MPSLDITQWSADDYVGDLTVRQTGQNAKVEGKLLKKYPPIFGCTRYEMQPCTVKDKEGNIMLWYLPGALTKQRSVSSLYPLFRRGLKFSIHGKTQMWEDMPIVDRSLRVHQSCKNWRVAPTFFRAQEGWLKPGSMSMSPAWFQQAHEVYNRIMLMSWLLIFICRSPTVWRFPRN